MAASHPRVAPARSSKGTPVEHGLAGKGEHGSSNDEPYSAFLPPVEAERRARRPTGTKTAMSPGESLMPNAIGPLHPRERWNAFGAKVRSTIMLRLVSAPSGPARRLVSPLLVTGLVWLGGCGPSFEAIQEGDLRFAHCDRLDLDRHISASHRLHCWREWQRVYTYGQTRDRVEYAKRRIAEVSSGDPDPPFELPSGESRRPDAHAPAPNPVHSPPPAVLPATGSESVLADGAAGANSGPACRSRCEANHTGCAPGCETQPTGCEDCKSALKRCLDNCKTAQP